MNKKQRAFTLIELLVVISIVGIISGIVVVQMNGAINAVNDSTKKTDLNTIKKALTIYKAETGNAYPSEAGCTIGSCTNLDSALSGILPESFSNDYIYSSNGTSYTISSILSSGYAYQYDSATNTFESMEQTDGICGSSDGANLSSIPSSNLCTVGTASSVSGSGPWTWTCTGMNGGAVDSCSANLTLNGSCGTANGKAYSSSSSSYGSDTICVAGTQNPTTVNFPDAGSSSSWTCVGQNSGTTASCSASRNAAATCPSSATCSTVGTDYVIKWTTVGSYSWTAPSGVTSVQYLVVAGGGGGGEGNSATAAAGGGGGGGMKTGTGLTVVPGNSYTVTVGNGGSCNQNGGASVFSTISTTGGGKGAGFPLTGSILAGDGGSGGGGYDNTSYGTGIVGEGNDGGHAATSGYAGSGGGGKGSVGSGGSSSGGVGGSGGSSSITGTDLYYAAGGGGGGISRVGGTGGSSIGGNGGNSTSGSNGAVNTGSGGGGGGNGLGGAGGSGIVIVRFPLP